MTNEQLPISRNVAGKLGYYVYVYIDPRTNEPFYVGKGKNGRALAHLSEIGESEKLTRIQEIKESGDIPRIEILAHKLRDERSAFDVEAAAIDSLGLEKLCNRVRGSKSLDFGRMTLQQLIGHYEADPIEFDEPILLIRINQTYRHNMSPVELYEATRGTWKMGDRRTAAIYAIPVFHYVTKEVYRIDSWHPAGSTPYEKIEHSPSDRVEFVGETADAEIRERYINRDVSSYFKKGNSGSFRYVNF